MESITYTSLRKNLSSILDKTEQDSTPMRIVRKNHKNIVMITEEDYSSLNETLYVMSSFENMNRLTQSQKAAKEGELFDLDLNGY